jgi:hypothetical protein
MAFSEGDAGVTAVLVSSAFFCGLGIGISMEIEVNGWFSSGWQGKPLVNSIIPVKAENATPRHVKLCKTRSWAGLLLMAGKPQLCGIIKTRKSLQL